MNNFLLTFVVLAVCGSLAHAQAVEDIESAIDQVYNKCKKDPSLDLQHDKFDWDLFGKFNQGKVNTLVSPISLKLVLAMLYIGSGSRTRDQIQQVMDFKPDDTLVQRKFKSIRKCLKPGPNADYILNIGTRMYVDKTITIKQKFSSIIEDTFQTEIKKMDKDTPLETVLDASQWIREISRGNINDLITKDDLVDVVILMLSSLYFKGSWINQFQSNDTKTGTFYLNGEDSVAVPMMTQVEKFAYFDSRELEAKILKMQFRGEGLSMTIVLPNSIKGLPKMMRHLTASDISREMMFLRNVNVRVTIPRFKYSFKSQLVPVLRELGITDLFETSASLSGIAQGVGLPIKLSVNNILQKAGIEVNEQGTTAYAATAVTLVNKFGVDEEQPEDFVADKPFLFFIEDNNTKQVLFSGTVNDPTKTFGELEEKSAGSVVSRFGEPVPIPSKEPASAQPVYDRPAYVYRAAIVPTTYRPALKTGRVPIIRATDNYPYTQYQQYN